MKKWRISRTYFIGAGEYTLGSIKVHVDKRGEFYFDGPQDAPLYAMASIVGSKRDVPYRKTLWSLLHRLTNSQSRTALFAHMQRHQN